MVHYAVACAKCGKTENIIVFTVQHKNTTTGMVYFCEEHQHLAVSHRIGVVLTPYPLTDEKEE